MFSDIPPKCLGLGNVLSPKKYLMIKENVCVNRAVFLELVLDK
jgi:hypothetical protein